MPNAAYRFAPYRVDIERLRRGGRSNLREEGALSAIEEEQASGLSRRGLFAAGAAGATAVVAGVEAADAEARTYPRHRVIALSKLRVNRAVTFDYPLKGQSNMLIDLGGAVPGGVGPKKSIVAFSSLCQHMGCPVGYDRGRRELVCPCHQTRYDPERLGSIIQGVATRALPRVHLEVRRGAVYAVGVDGLIYGYRTNLAPGKKVGGGS
jgi:arsenite oxidase small subunit